MAKLSYIERNLLRELAIRPNGGALRDGSYISAARRLAARGFVSEPKGFGGLVFTSITSLGRQALTPTEGVVRDE